jgi:hypothetical protein
MSDFQIDTELLISLIEARPVLWDNASDIYKDRLCKADRLFIYWINLMYPIFSVFSVTSVQKPHSKNAPPVHSRNEE